MKFYNYKQSLNEHASQLEKIVRHVRCYNYDLGLKLIIIGTILDL